MSPDPQARLVRIRDPILLHDDPPDAVYDLLAERLRPPRLSWKYRMYYLARPLIPLSLRHYLQHKTRPAVARAEWYIERSLLRAYATWIPDGDWRAVVALWPMGARWAVSLTHDVETDVGFQNIEPVVRIEERYGFRSSWNLVAHKYRIDDGYVRSLKERGFEIGIHGYNHDGWDYFARPLFRRRARYVNQAMRRYGAVGFRSPQAQRNLEWMQELEIAYDSSCFDVDPFQPMPGGTGSIWPFHAGRFVEIPYTVPQDHVLFISLRESGNEIWKLKTKWLMEHHGLASVVTHPDYLMRPKLLRHYEDYLAFLAQLADCWRATPAEVATWWNARAQSRVAGTGQEPRVDGPAEGYGATVLHVGSKDGRLVFRW